MAQLGHPVMGESPFFKPRTKATSRRRTIAAHQAFRVQYGAKNQIEIPARPALSIDGRNAFVAGRDIEIHATGVGHKVRCKNA